MDSETTPLIAKRPSPYHACVPALLTAFSTALSSVIVSQWLLLHLCARYQDGSGFPGWGSYVEPIPVTWEGCRQNTFIQALTAKWLVIAQMMFSIPAMLFGPFWGLYCDRFGRKAMFLIPPIVSICATAGMLITDYLNLGLWFTLVIHMFAGVVSNGPIAALLAYMTDTTEPESRSVVFVRIQAIVTLPTAFGPFIGGVMSRAQFHHSSIFYLTIFGQILTLLYTVFVLPESLKTVENSKKQSIFETISKVATVFKGFNTSMLLVIFASTLVAASNTSKNIFFYYMALVFGWDAYDDGQYLLVIQILNFSYMLFVFPAFAYVFAKKDVVGAVSFDINMVRLSLFMAAGGICLTGLAETQVVIYLLALMCSFEVLAMPTLRTLISNQAGDQCAQTFATMQLLSDLASLLFSMLSHLVWAQTLGWFPSLYLYLTGSLFAVALFLMAFTRPYELINE
ncbi:major facilitator superfamily domain-containing protein [Gorgonomyces haynaldii]|nr:major facilitator superfamily domain-containing protein [Gorgonomyces haynaldii]